MTGALLRAEEVSKRFGGVSVLESVSLQIREKEIMALIGPNGAGKTTLFNIFCGYERADTGTVVFGGRDISRKETEAIARSGMSRTFQTTQVFRHLSVIENILVGRYTSTRISFPGAWLRAPAVYRKEHENQGKAYEILEFLGLYEKANRNITQITHMERKLIELGRALAMEPRLLLLDEPFGGLNQEEMRRFSGMLKGLPERGLAILIIDHHFSALVGLADDVAVLHEGRIISHGPASEISEDPAVKAAYFSGIEDGPA